MAYSCPQCRKVFEDLYVVHSNSMEPFTSDPRDLKRGLEAYSVYGIEKDVICHQGAWLHFRFVESGEERLVQMRKVDEAGLQTIREKHAAEIHECQHEGCEERGTPYYYNQLDAEVGAWYCDQHVYEGGFCAGCGYFCAGFESFDFSKSGLCESCEEELREEMGESGWAEGIDWDDWDDEY